MFYDLLEYKFDEELRNRIYSEFIKDIDNIITLKSKKFDEYKCGLMDVNNFLGFYRCNMSHHHGINFHKHWSVVQKTQNFSNQTFSRPNAFTCKFKNLSSN